MTAAVDSPCVEWTGARHHGGYGVGKAERDGGSRLVHRIEWERHNGPVPLGLFVLHRCDNPPCHNIDHLFLGTKGDNNRDTTAKGRHHYAKRDRCIRGHELTPENVWLLNGARYCKTCSAARLRAFRAARRSARAAA